MTTLEERREWMRRGCPVETPARFACLTFKLHVWPDKGEIRATCESCGTIHAGSGMALRGEQVDSVFMVMRLMCDWLDYHSEAPRETARETLVNSADGWPAVLLWADYMMLGKEDELRLQCIPSEAVNQHPRGRYLYRLSPEPMFPGASGFRDDRSDATAMAAASLGRRSGVSSEPFKWDRTLRGPEQGPDRTLRGPEQGPDRTLQKQGAP
ncbi:hypothetical protein LCGC14_0953150 [marine sediment metagenome]|uniref:Uncharacterized protein n=1 Tax=marine sediment metagenome TaxID=412755 RepID=A0A0F9NL73_9ZZZZ